MIQDVMIEAIAHQFKSGVPEKAEASSDTYVGHRAWIKVLLSDYYDPMYDFQLEKKAARVAFRGDKQAMLEKYAL